MEKRLYRSKSDKVIAGVCGGLAQYLNFDVSLVRLAAVLFLFTGGMGFLAYLVLLIVVPEEPVMDSTSTDHNVYPSPMPKREHHPLFLGGLLIAIGCFFLVKQFIGWIDHRTLLAIILISIGGYLIFKPRKW